MKLLSYSHLFSLNIYNYFLLKIPAKVLFFVTKIIKTTFFFNTFVILNEIFNKKIFSL